MTYRDFILSLAIVLSPVGCKDAAVNLNRRVYTMELTGNGLIYSGYAKGIGPANLQIAYYDRGSDGKLDVVFVRKGNTFAAHLPGDPGFEDSNNEFAKVKERFGNSMRRK